MFRNSKTYSLTGPLGHILQPQQPGVQLREPFLQALADLKFFVYCFIDGYPKSVFSLEAQFLDQPADHRFADNVDEWFRESIAFLLEP